MKSLRMAWEMVRPKRNVPKAMYKLPSKHSNWSFNRTGRGSGDMRVAHMRQAPGAMKMNTTAKLPKISIATVISGTSIASRIVEKNHIVTI